MKRNIHLITIIMYLFLILFISCTANTKPNIYHSFITIKISSITNLSLPIYVYVYKSNENSYELMGIITSDKYSDEYDSSARSYNINFYLDEGNYNIKFIWYIDHQHIEKEYILKNERIEKGQNYKYDLEKIIK